MVISLTFAQIVADADSAIVGSDGSSTSQDCAGVWMVIHGFQNAVV